jgi:hypothetical protein
VTDADTNNRRQQRAVKERKTFLMCCPGGRTAGRNR